MDAGTVLGLLGVAQGQFQHSNDLSWNEIDYYLQVRQVRVDVLSNVREDLQDLFEKDERQLDTYLIVTTLCLGLGFGFVVEGTFPQDTKDQEVGRVIYAFVAGLSLVFPFWSLIGLIECRHRMIYFMKCFNESFYKEMNKEHRLFLDETERAQVIRQRAQNHTQELPQALPLATVWRACPRRQRRGSSGSALEPEVGLDIEEQRDAVETGNAATVRSQRDQDKDRIEGSLKFHNDYLKWWKAWCEDLMRYSLLSLRAAVGLNVLCAALLLGLYFNSEYPDTPAVWIIYVFVVMSGLVTGGAWYFFQIQRGPESTVGALRRRYREGDFIDGDASERGLPWWVVFGEGVDGEQSGLDELRERLLVQ